jgi:RNA-directed DNA polymerase
MSIDLCLANVWRSYFLFRRGKKPSAEINNFQYYLENNLYKLYSDLNSGRYRHGGYRHFVVSDNKKRQVAVSSLRDRVVHRLVYEYLVKMYDRTFIYDVWSNRKGKGLLGAVYRSQIKIYKYRNSHIWRADIKKFFDSVRHNILLEILALKIESEAEFKIIKEIINSYFDDSTTNERTKRGLPIGNLTSQILSNIYLNELDRYVKNYLKPQFYLRYGDDFIVMEKDRGNLSQIRRKIIKFLDEKLDLEINNKNDIIIKPSWGLKFLGTIIYPQGRRLSKRNIARIKERLSLINISSYQGQAKANQPKLLKIVNWQSVNCIDQI